MHGFFHWSDAVEEVERTRDTGRGPRFAEHDPDDPFARQSYRTHRSPTPVPETQFAQPDPDDLFGRRHAPLTSPTPRVREQEGGIYWDEYDPHATWTVPTRHFIQPDRAELNRLMAPDAPVYVEPHYSFQEQLQNSYRAPRDYHWEAYRWPRDGDPFRWRNLDDATAAAPPETDPPAASNRWFPYTPPRAATVAPEQADRPAQRQPELDELDDVHFGRFAWRVTSGRYHQGWDDPGPPPVPAEPVYAPAYGTGAAAETHLEPDEYESPPLWFQYIPPGSAEHEAPEPEDHETEDYEREERAGLAGLAWS